MKKIKSKLAGADQLGSATELNYKRVTSYGTVIGGIVSILVTLAIAVFTIAQFATIKYNPQYNQTYGTKTDRTDEEIDILEGMPVFSFRYGIDRYDIYGDYDLLPCPDVLSNHGVAASQVEKMIRVVNEESYIELDDWYCLDTNTVAVDVRIGPRITILPRDDAETDLFVAVSYISRQFDPESYEGDNDSMEYTIWPGQYLTFDQGKW